MHTYRVYKILKNAGCDVVLSCGALLGYRRTGTFLLHDLDSDLICTNKTDGEIFNILNESEKSSRLKIGRAKLCYGYKSWAKVQFASYEKFDCDVFTKESYFNYRGPENSQNAFEKCLDTSPISVQGLIFDAPRDLEGFLIDSYGVDYITPPNNSGPIFDRDSLDLSKVYDTPLVIGGTFDPFHYGHISLIQKAKAVSDNVVPMLCSKAFAHTYGKSPQSDMTRLMGAKIKGFSLKIWNGNPEDHIESSFFFGGDSQEQAQEYADKYYGKVNSFWVKRHPGISSTMIRNGEASA